MSLQQLLAPDRTELFGDLLVAPAVEQRKLQADHQRVHPMIMLANMQHFPTTS
jgi:hypothetical protein